MARPGVEGSRRVKSCDEPFILNQEA